MRERGRPESYDDTLEEGTGVSSNRQMPVTLSSNSDYRSRLARILAIACLSVIVVASTQVRSQPAQGATLAGGSIFKGSPKVVERRLCLAIPMSAVDPLYTVKVGKPTTGFLGSTCDFVQVGKSANDDSASPLFVEIAINDYGQMYGTFNKDDHKLSGIGDKAYWDSQAPGMDAPQVIAEKGNIACTVTTNGEVDQTTLPYTVSGGNPVVTNAAAAKFAAKMGVICSDVFKGK
jgi:hypothetical protein